MSRQRAWLLGSHCLSRLPTNSFWSLAEVLAAPIVLVILTSILLERLGQTSYGLWIFALSFAGVGALGNLGMTSAAQRYVAFYRGQQGKAAEPGVQLHAPRVSAVVVQSMLISLGGTAAVAIVLAGAAPLLARTIFSDLGTSSETVWLVRLAGLLVIAQQVEAMSSSVLRGLERFRLAAQLEVISKCILGAGLVIVTDMFPTFRAVLLTTILCSATSALAKCLVIKRLLQLTGRREGCAVLDLELLRYGAWAWLHSIAGVLFQQMDRLALAALLGANAVAAYAAASQLGALLHVVLSSAFAISLPRVSRELGASAAPAPILQYWRRAVLLGTAAAAASGVVLFGAGRFVLELWLGASIAAEVWEVFPWVVLAYALLSVSVLPHFVLLSVGRMRIVSLANLLAAVAGLSVVYPAVSHWGTAGGAASRVVFAALLMICYFALFPQRATSI